MTELFKLYPYIVAVGRHRGRDDYYIAGLCREAHLKNEPRDIVFQNSSYNWVRYSKLTAKEKSYLDKPLLAILKKVKLV